jgi:pimeloyl-ACP methyl ester carboxylesterase
MRELELPVGDMTFLARENGPDDGEPVLLLHGFPESSYQWLPQLAALGHAGYRVVAPDQRGYSPRACPPAVADYAIAELVGDVLGFADALGVERFHLVGHDWGAAVAWVTACAHPERLLTLTSVATPHPVPFGRSMREGEQREKSAYMAELRDPGAEAFFLDDGAAGLRRMYESFGFPEQTIAEYVALLTRPGALTGALNWYRANDIAGTAFELPPVTVPTLYVWPVNDAYLGREAAEATAEQVEGPYRFVELEGVSHWVCEEVPDRLNQLLLDHFRDL